MTHHEGITDGIAAAAATSPLWLPSLREASEIAGLIVPILGAIWLVLQITLKLHAHFKPRAPIDLDDGSA